VDDQELIKRIASNDHVAFKALVELYQSSVLEICYRLLNNQEDAEDVAQEVFVRVFQKARSFRGESKVSTWLYRIAVNLSLNYRHKQKWNRYLDILTLSDTTREDAATRLEAPEKDRPDRRIEEKERNRVLSEALASLPERQRVAFVLHKFESLSYKEIADVLGTSVSSVESLVHRAKRSLQKKLLHSIGKL